MTARDEIVKYISDRLNVELFEDASANGLQVQGTDEVSKVGLVTDAAMATYRRAKAEGCELIVAHHGLIWGGGLRSISGRNYEHIRFLLENQINLYAVHLPLDAHLELGNNAQLASMLGIESKEPFGNYNGVTLGVKGALPVPMALDALALAWQKKIGGTPTQLPFGANQVRDVAIVSGGGSGCLKEAIDLGVDCFVTGEGKHEDHHEAKEAGINVLYLGHYHSETAGVKALGSELASRFDVECLFIDEPTLI